MPKAKASTTKNVPDSGASYAIRKGLNLWLLNIEGEETASVAESLRFDSVEDANFTAIEFAKDNLGVTFEVFDVVGIKQISQVLFNEA